MKRFILKIIFSFSLLCILSAILVFSSFGADTFEKQISEFPETYKVSLRQLHKKYPEWKFECVKTELNWSDAVKNESDLERNAVPKASSNLCKSYATGYYFPETGKFKETDAGWVNASPDTVAYFLDPRNFLNETDIFQFELLSFSSEIKESDVEKILRGTFMYNSKISYYDTKGNLVNTSVTYSSCIYNAGKTYNINPCFLASKIKNEVVSAGGMPSGSVSGKYKGYEGYYNFFNIGAYAGVSPISNGLKYASTSGSYNRPWNTPEKSINGGAQFLASSYISKGQDTGYFQKFNTSPKAVSKPYTHQYMSNVSGADSQGYSTYLSYYEDDLMNMKRTFSIPVYNDMPGADSFTKDFTLFDTKGQKATTTTALNVRTEPTTSSTAIVTVRANTTVTVLKKCRNTSTKYSQHLYYPYWYYISFSQDGKNYTGYVVADYLTINSSLNVNNLSTFELPGYSLGKEKPTYYTWDTSVITINNDGTFKALKNGTAYVYATTSGRGYDYIKIKVGSYNNSSLAVSGFSLKQTESGVNFSWNKNANASGYELIVYEGNKVILTQVLSSSSTTYNAVINSSSSLNARIRAYKLSGTEKLNGSFAVINNFKLKPVKVSGLFCDNITTNSFRLRWNKADSVNGYEILRYNSTTRQYDVITNTINNSYTFSQLGAGVSNLYTVRAYFENGGTRIRGEASSSVYGYTYKYDFGNLKSVSAKKTMITVKWNLIKGADKYVTYIYDNVNNKYIKKGETSSAYFQFTSLHSAQTYNILIEAFSGSQVLSVGKFTVKTALKSVKNLKQISSTGYKITVTWSKRNGADAYRIYVYDSANKSYALFKETGDNTCVIETNPLSGKTIKVCAVVKNYSNKSNGDFSSELNIYSGTKKSSKISIGSLSSDYVSLKWSKVKSASGYNLYFINADKSLKLIGTTSGTSFSINTLAPSNRYKIRLIPYRLVGSKKIDGSVTDISFITPPDAVSSIKATDVKTKSYTIEWKSDKNADGYIIYRYNSSMGIFEKIGETTSAKYSVKNLYSAKTDSYKIAGYIVIDGLKYVGKMSSKFKVSTTPKNPTNLKAVKQNDGSISVSFTKAPRSHGSKIFIMDSVKNKWVYLGYTSGSTFVIAKDKIPEKADSILVKSYVKVSSVRYLSGGSSVKF